MSIRSEEAEALDKAIATAIAEHARGWAIPFYMGFRPFCVKCSNGPEDRVEWPCLPIRIVADNLDVTL